MTDVFISYSSHDEQLASFVREHLKLHKLDVFMAALSLQPGKPWTPQVLEALRASEWVFLLASKQALESQYVQLEVGGALGTNKKLVPIMWDVGPADLPSWVSDYQGLTLKGATHENINQRMSQLAAHVKAEKTKGMLMAGAMVAGLLYLLAR